MTELALPLGIAALAVLAVTPLVRALAVRFGAVDRGDGERKLHCQPVPLLGGLVLLLALAVPLLLALWTGAGDEQAMLGPLLLSAGMLCLVGCWDDLRGMRVRWKLLGQIASTLPLVVGGHLLERVELFDFTWQLGWFGIPLTMAWLVAVVNALNFLDGVDGLAATVSMCTAAAIAAIAFGMGNAAALTGAALTGGLAGFLFFNWHPAKIYLGDAGSMLLGLVLAVLSVEGTSPPGSAVLVAPLALLAVPLSDLFLAVVRRSLRGKGFWIADRAHVHHRLLERGMTPRQTVLLLTGMNLVTASAAALAAAGNELAACAVLAILFAAAVRLRLLGHHELALTRGRIVSAAGRVLSTHPAGWPARAKPLGWLRRRPLSADPALPALHLVSDEEPAANVMPGQRLRDAA